MARGKEQSERKEGFHEQLSDMRVDELQDRAREKGISGASGMRKEELIEALEKHQDEK